MLINTISNTIRGRYRLQYGKERWSLADGVRIYASEENSFGFSLDNPQNPPFAFLSNTPPEHTAKMCDAIIVQLNDKAIYFFVIEQKTGYEGDYEKQLANGKFFCKWLVSLLKYHGYLKDIGVKYIGLLVWKSRQSPTREGTSHESIRHEDHPLFPLCYSVENKSNFSLQELIR